VTQTQISAQRIEGGYLIKVGDQEEPLLGGPGSPGYLEEVARVGKALGVRGAEVMAAVESLFSDEVDQILGSVNPLEEIGRILDDAIAGEDDNKRLLFVLLLSAKTQSPDLCEMILFKSSSGGGKSTLANLLTGFYRTKKVGRLSRTALDHSDLQNMQILYLQELGQMDNEEYGVSTIKFLSSEDEGYIVEITVRDKDTGDFTTVEKKIPPLTVVSSTTRVNIDGQYERRNWILSVDETPEQTERIRRLNAKHELEEAEIHLGLRSETSKDRAKRLLKAVVENIEPRQVAILFPDTLMSVLTSQRLRIRGDFKKITRLLKYYAWLKQRTIPRIELNGETILFPTPRDAVEILRVAQRSLIYMTQDLEGRDLKLLEAMERLDITRKGDVITPEIREELRLTLGYTKGTILIYLNHLVDRGFLTDDDRRPKTYTLVESLASIKRSISSVSDVIEDAETFILQMTQEATKNLDALIKRRPELEKLRAYFTYVPDLSQEYASKEVFGISKQSPNNPQKHKMGLNQPHFKKMGKSEAQNPNPKTTPTHMSREKQGLENSSTYTSKDNYEPKVKSEHIPRGKNWISKQNPIIPKKPKIGLNQPSFEKIGLNWAQNPNPIFPHSHISTDQKPREESPGYIAENNEPSGDLKKGQAKLVPEPEPETSKTPPESQLMRDIDTFSRAVWNHQEEQQKGPISFKELEKRLGWSTERLTRIIHLVRRRQIPGIQEVRPGYLGCIW